MNSQAPPEDPILYECADAVATITLNRPSAMNALNAELREQLVAAIGRAEEDDGARMVAIRGAGERAFSAGADVNEFVPTDSIVDTREVRQSGNWNDVIASCSKPTLALIHGYCLGGGLEIALACDFRVASSSGVFGFPEVTLGLIPGAGGTQRLPRVIGLGPAIDLICSARRIGADEALSIGLISEVPSSLDDAVTDWAGRLSKVAPVAYAYAKEAMVRGTSMPLADGLSLEADLATMLTNSRDREEGVTAWREGRSAAYPQ